MEEVQWGPVCWSMATVDLKSFSSVSKRADILKHKDQEKNRDR